MTDGPYHFIRSLPARVVSSWMIEFGYTQHTPEDIIAERGLTRWAHELDLHGKRLAERARMASVPTGRAGVIR